MLVHIGLLVCKKTEIIYFDNFGVERVPKENKKFIGHKNIKETYLEHKQATQ